MATAEVMRKTLQSINPSLLRTLTTHYRHLSAVATAGLPESDDPSSSFTFSSEQDVQSKNSDESNENIFIKAPKTPPSSSVTMPMSFMTGSIVGKRFYKKVTTREAEDGNGWNVMLDYRTLKTPCKKPLKCPSPSLAMAVAAEWDYQEADGIRPFTMPLMKLACTALERVPVTRPKIIDHLMKKFPQDLVFCRAPGDNVLTSGVLERQVEKIDPLLAWVESEFGFKPVVYSSFFGGKQEDGLLKAIEGLLKTINDCELAAIDALASAAHSLIIAIGLFRGRLQIEEAIELIRLEEDLQVDRNTPELSDAGLGSAAAASGSEDLVNSVDQFLREALQNPRERVSVLRMEQDVEKFIRDPTRQQMEFQQLPTSYLRLAAHRVAQHYSLQSMVLLDNSLPDGSASRIIVRKTSECRLPMIRLADIPVNLPTENSGVVKVAIKQRPHKRSQAASSANSHSSKNNNSKSVEERKEEYNRARARIFNSSTSSGGPAVKPESEPRVQDRFQHGSQGISKIEEIPIPVGTDVNIGRNLVNSAGSSRSVSSRTEKEPVGRFKTNNRVAIFRDREVERKDPDFDRSYDRYAQRFDPGFGFNGGPYTIQPLYSPVLNYSTEFPQLGSAHRPSIPAEHQPRPLTQHLPGPWAAPSTPTGIGYVPSETMMTPFSPNHVGTHSASALYLHSSQFPCQQPGMQFIHPHEQVHQPFSQSHQQKPDASFGLARLR